jgi:hypothetical protein
MKADIYPAIDEVLELQSYEINLGSTVNLASSSLNIKMETTVGEMISDDYLLVNIPAEILSNTETVSCE